MTRKHYSDLDKKIFKEILRKWAHVIESKSSGANTLREKETAWAEISQEYNASSLITETRTTQQLRKLWSNLKHVQRDALTAERQAIRGTGGGPMAPSATIDPDIAMIAPHLMTTAPVLFTSSMTSAEITDQHNAFLDAAASGLSMSELATTTDGAVNDLGTNDSEEAGNANSMDIPIEDFNTGPSTSSVVQQCGNADELRGDLNAARITQPSSSSTSQQNAGRRGRRPRRNRSPEITEEALRIKRMESIIKREEELGEMKKRHMAEIYAVELATAKTIFEREQKLLKET